MIKYKKKDYIEYDIFLIYEEKKNKNVPIELDLLKENISVICVDFELDMLLHRDDISKAQNNDELENMIREKLTANHWSSKFDFSKKVVDELIENFKENYFSKSRKGKVAEKEKISLKENQEQEKPRGFRR